MHTYKQNSIDFVSGLHLWLLAVFENNIVVFSDTTELLQHVTWIDILNSWGEYY